MRENVRHLSKRFSLPLILATVGGTLLVGMLAGLLSGAMRGYGSIALPPLAPPDWVFPVVWSVLYAMIGLSLFFLVRKQAFTSELLSNKNNAIWLWIAQLIFNLAWPFAFFAFKLYAFSFVWLLMLVAINMALIIISFKVSPPAAWLLIPYEAWLLFAAYLNLYIAILN